MRRCPCGTMVIGEGDRCGTCLTPARPGPSLTMSTDGSVFPNPGGPGGWAAVFRQDGRTWALSGPIPAPTTNNVTELTAVVAGLEALDTPHSVVVRTDSLLVMSCATGLGRRKAETLAQLWPRYDAQARRHAVTWRWVRGHTGDPDNEMADRLARDARLRLPLEAP